MFVWGGDVYIHMYVYIYTYIHMHARIHTYTNLHVCMHVTHVHCVTLKCIAGTTLGNFMKAMIELAKLPPTANAASIRRGVINFLYGSQPLEYLVFVTGHELQFLTAWVEYVHASIPIIITTALPLAGHAFQRSGKICRGPQPASLDALEVCSMCARYMRVYAYMAVIYTHIQVCPRESVPWYSICTYKHRLSRHTHTIHTCRNASKHTG